MEQGEIDAELVSTAKSGERLRHRIHQYIETVLAPRCYELRSEVLLATETKALVRLALIATNASDVLSRLRAAEIEVSQPRATFLIQEAKTEGPDYIRNLITTRFDDLLNNLESISKWKTDNPRFEQVLVDMLQEVAATLDVVTFL